LSKTDPFSSKTYFPLVLHSQLLHLAHAETSKFYVEKKIKETKLSTKEVVKN